jgi:hypothetical protein
MAMRNRSIQPTTSQHWRSQAGARPASTAARVSQLDLATHLQSAESAHHAGDRFRLWISLNFTIASARQEWSAGAHGGRVLCHERNRRSGLDRTIAFA